MGWGRSVCGVPASNTLQFTPHSAYMYARLDPTHDAGKKDRQKEAPTHTTNTHTHTHICTAAAAAGCSPQISLSRLEMKSKPSLKRSPILACPSGGWVRDGNLDGVVELDMPKDYKLNAPRTTKGSINQTHNYNFSSEHPPPPQQTYSYIRIRCIHIRQSINKSKPPPTSDLGAMTQFQRHDLYPSYPLLARDFETGLGALSSAFDDEDLIPILDREDDSDLSRPDSSSRCSSLSIPSPEWICPLKDSLPSCNHILGSISVAYQLPRAPPPTPLITSPNVLPRCQGELHLEVPPLALSSSLAELGVCAAMGNPVFIRRPSWDFNVEENLNYKVGEMSVKVSQTVMTMNKSLGFADHLIFRAFLTHGNRFVHSVICLVPMQPSTARGRLQLSREKIRSRNIRL